MNTLDLVYLKIIEIAQSFWIKTVFTVIGAYFMAFYNSQSEAHSAVVVLFILDGIVGTAHARVRGDFDRYSMLGKFKVKIFAYAILIITASCVDLATVKGHTEFGFHYGVLVFLALTEAKSISSHLEAFNIRVPFKKKIDDMLNNLYNK